GVVKGTVQNFIMKAIGYEQGKKIGTQDERTKRWLFILSAAMPTITGALGILPKLLWPIDRKKRAKMYYELSEQRSAAVSDYVASVSELPGSETAGTTEE
ncbi:MAG: hypothetical protein IJL26_12815, partial [Clostridia bacterium]|nr:hypothetical protein [Clostridia bacterium]